MLHFSWYIKIIMTCRTCEMSQNLILSFKTMYLMPEDGQYVRNMYHALTRVTKLVVVDGSTYVSQI